MLSQAEQSLNSISDSGPVSAVAPQPAVSSRRLNAKG
jgi:hypothetical protein